MRFADGDDRVGQVEEGVYDVLAAFVAASEPVEGVVPGVGALDLPAAAGLDGCFLALVGNLSMQAASGEFVAGLGGVVAGVQVHGDVVGQRTEVVEFVQSRSQKR